MATYYIYRKYEPNLTCEELEKRALAFETLYCRPGQGDPYLEMIIRGEWPGYERDGLFLRYNGGAKIVAINRDNVTIQFKNDEGVVERAHLPLLDDEAGYSEIMFISVHPKGGGLS